MNNGLKASELRPGNIVDMGFGPEPVNEYQIYQFSLYQLGAREPGYYKDWKPVELTEKIVSDMGLVNDGTYAYFLGEFKPGAYYIELEEDEDDDEEVSEAWMFKIVVAGALTFFQSKTLREMRHAHELQNLVFYLTDKELIFKTEENG